MGATDAELTAEPSGLATIASNPLFEHAIAKTEWSIDLEQYQRLLSEVNTAATNNEKGNSLEALVHLLLDSVPVFVPHGPETGTGFQIDNAVFVSNIPGYWTQNWGDWCVVECRNKQEAVEANEIRDFVGKFYDRHIVGILFTRSGISTGAVEHIRNCSRDKHKFVLVVSMADLESVGRGENFADILFDKYKRVCFL